MKRVKNKRERGGEQNCYYYEGNEISPDTVFWYIPALWERGGGGVGGTRERERQTDRQTDRQRQRDRETEREREFGHQSL